MRRFVIQGEPVSAKNSQQIRFNRKTGARYITKSKAAAEWQADAIAQLVKQRGRTKTLRGDVRVQFVAYQRGRRDLDNIASAVLDALKKSLVIADDMQVTALAGEKVTLKDCAPCIEIVVAPIGES